MEFGNPDGAPFAILAMFDRVDHPAKGRSGGASGAAGVVALKSGRVLRSKGQQTVPAGDLLRLELPGGGGHGDPLDRDAERVAEDVRDGLVSAEAAREHYGVALDGDGAVDAVATRKIRQR
jgi:N-methylhydantoinase B